ncbi:MAG: hypothetical protein WCF18_15095 [Chthoniobacteraceae bacterium]
MKTQLFRLLAILALIIPAFAVEIKPPTFIPASGLQLSLNTGGYKFFVGDTTTPPVAANARAARLGGLMPTREGFAARAILANTSRSAIPFEFDDAGAAATKFRFSVVDADGVLVWQSDSDVVSPQVVTPATLGKGERWKRMVQIPLKVDGAWLKPGIYTLETMLTATPSVSATTIFEVANLPEVPTGESGINGHVVEQGSADSVNALPAPTPVKAQISIMEKRLPNARYDHPAFFWTGPTDDSGNFKVTTPPGTFIVTAFRTSIITATPLSNFTTANLIASIGAFKTAEVTVEAGKYSEVTLTFQVTPLPTTGINGLVLIGPVSPVQVIGQNNEQPLAGAQVEIVEIQKPGVFYIRGPWSWTLTAGPDGKFTQATPPGRYRVTASTPQVIPVNEGPINTLVHRLPFGSGSAEVTVTDSGFADATIHVDSGIR